MPELIDPETYTLKGLGSWTIDITPERVTIEHV